MSLDIVVEKYSYSIPMELVTAAIAEAVHEDGFTKGAYWMIFTVIGVVVVSFLVWIFVPDKPARQTEPVEPAQRQLEQPAQPEQSPQPVEPQLSQPQQTAQNEQIDEANEQQRPIHTYNLRGRQSRRQSRRRSRGQSRGQSRSPPLDRQVHQQDQSDDEQPTLYLDDNGHGGRQRISAGPYPTNAKKVVLKRNSYTHSTAEYHLNN